MREIAEALALTEASSSGYKHKLPFPKPNKILLMSEFLDNVNPCPAGRAGPEADRIWKLGSPLPFPLWTHKNIVWVWEVSSLYTGLSSYSQYHLDLRSHLLPLSV